LKKKRAPCLLGRSILNEKGGDLESQTFLVTRNELEYARKTESGPQKENFYVTGTFTGETDRWGHY